MKDDPAGDTARIHGPAAPSAPPVDSEETT
jgi:hypothetical protein